MGIYRVGAVAFAILAATAGWAGQGNTDDGAYCRLQLGSRATPSRYDLGVADSAVLKLRDGSESRAIFLGRRSVDGEDRLYFVESGSGAMVYVPRSEISDTVTREESQLVPNRSNVIEFVQRTVAARLDAISIEPIPSLQAQHHNDCAAYSVFHCMRTLRDLGRLPDPDLQQRLERDPLAVLEELRASEVNADNLPGKLELFWEATRRLFKERHWEVDAGGKRQIRRMLEYLDRHHLRGTQVRSFELLRQHLVGGLPAILNVRMKAVRVDIFRLSPIIHSDEKHVGKRPSYGPTRDKVAHSTVARAWINDGSPLGKVLVYDSAPDSFYVVDGEELAAAMRWSAGAILVSPD